jgi:hypothetical protein
MRMAELEFCDQGWMSDHRAAVSVTRRDEGRCGELVQQRERVAVSIRSIAVSTPPELPLSAV